MKKIEGSPKNLKQLLRAEKEKALSEIPNDFLEK